MRKNQKLYAVTVIVLVVCFAMAIGVFAEEKAAKKQIEIEEIKDIENPDAEFKVDLWADKKDATYKPGEEIKFFFKTNKDCHLTLLNVGTSGKVKVLFPNEYQKDNLVKAGSTYSVPGEKAKYMYKASKPQGEEVVKAIATLKEVALYKPEDTAAAGPFQEMKKSEKEVAKDIEIALKPIPTKKWAEAEEILKIVENKP